MDISLGAQILVAIAMGFIFGLAWARRRKSKRDHINLLLLDQNTIDVDKLSAELCDAAYVIPVNVTAGQSVNDAYAWIWVNQ